MLGQKFVWPLHPASRVLPGEGHVSLALDSGKGLHTALPRNLSLVIGVAGEDEGEWGRDMGSFFLPP